MFDNEKLYISEIKSVVLTSGQTEQKIPLRASHAFGFIASAYGYVTNCCFGGRIVGRFSLGFSQNHKKGIFENCLCFDDCDSYIIPAINAVSRSNTDSICRLLNSGLELAALRAGTDVSKMSRWKIENNTVVHEKTVYISDKSTEDGSKEHPYTIRNADDFLKFTDEINRKNSFKGQYIVQTADIDLSGRTDYDGANGSGYPYTFAGIYDGLGHTLNVELDTVGQYVNNTVFPYIEGTVMNLGITGVVSSGGQYTSGFARSVRKEGTLVNCYSNATVSTRSEHDKIFELCCCISGSSKVFYEGTVQQFKSGDVMYIPKNLPASAYRIEFDSPMDSISIFFDTDYKMTDKLFITGASGAKNAEALFDKIYRTWIGRNSKYYLTCMSMLYELIAELSKPFGNYIPKNKYTKIEKGIDYLTKHCFDKNIDYYEPSRICGISYTYFKQLFIQKFEKPPMAYITEVRMERAAELLGTGSMSVTEIADKCGFEDVYYFSKAFKKYYGASPKNYISGNKQQKTAMKAY